MAVTPTLENLSRLNLLVPGKDRMEKAIERKEATPWGQGGRDVTKRDLKRKKEDGLKTFTAKQLSHQKLRNKPSHRSNKK